MENKDYSNFPNCPPPPPLDEKRGMYFWYLFCFSYVNLGVLNNIDVTEKCHFKCKNNLDLPPLKSGFFRGGCVSVRVW